MYILGTILLFIGLACATVPVVLLLVNSIGNVTGWFEIPFVEDWDMLAVVVFLFICILPVGVGLAIRDPYVEHNYYTVTTATAQYDHVVGFRRASDDHPYFSGTVDGVDMIFSDIVSYSMSDETYIPDEVRK